MAYFILAVVIITLIWLLVKSYLNNKKIKKELLFLEERIAPLDSIEQECSRIQNQIQEENHKYEELKQTYSEKIKIYRELEEKVSLYKDEVELIDNALYEPKYDFQTSQIYKQKLDLNYEKQKQAIKNNEAFICATEWVVQGSKTAGKKMIQAEGVLLLKAFNSQCDREIENVKWNNVNLIDKKILKLFDDINKMGQMHDISLSKKFLELKQEQLYITYEYAEKKYQEKEEQARLREQMREEEKILEEAEKARKAREEEEKQKAIYEKLRQEAYEKGQLDKAKEYDEIIAQKDETIEKLTRTESNAEKGVKRGHIYVISNIGSFGENIYKIGMTRRDEPKDRVNELGDASVPFKFDIHAMIYTENAPELEYKLHERFRNKSVNRVNYRKEFFRVSLEEIEQAVREYDHTDIMFTKIAEAKEFYQTQAILKAEDGKTEVKEKVEALPLEL